MKPLLLEHPNTSAWSQTFWERHLEEIDFLFDQRSHLFSDPTVPWTSISRTDVRIRGHANALNAWGKSAHEFVQTHLGRTETALPAAFFIASFGDQAAVTAAASVFGSAEAEVVVRLGLGFSFSRRVKTAPPLEVELAALLEPFLGDARSEVRAQAAHALGRLRRGRTSLLEDLFSDPEPEVRAAAAGALARLGARHVVPALERKVTELGEIALLWPLLELGSKNISPFCQTLLAKEKSPPGDLLFALAAAGDPGSVPLLRQVEPLETAVQAVGILGSPLGVPWLINSLASGDDAVKTKAAAALERITGAGLVETIDVPRPPSEQSQRKPTEKVVRPSTNRVTWERWWHTHRARFDEKNRYRGGSLFSVRAPVAELSAPTTLFADRIRAIAEIRHHSRPAMPFDCDGWILEQEQALRSFQSV